MFANIKIGLRLAAGFGSVLLLMAALTLVGLNGMATVDGKLNEIVGDNMYKIGLVNDMAEAVHVVTRITRTIVLLDDKDAQAAERRKLDAARQKYNDAFNALEKTSASEKGKAIRAKIKDLAGEARGLTDKVLELGMAGNDKEALRVLIEGAIRGKLNLLARR